MRPTGCWAESTKPISSAKLRAVRWERYYRLDRH
jgi:hypothetical protein